MRMKEFIERLQRNYTDDTIVIDVLWLGEDIESVVEEEGLVATEEQIDDLANILSRRHDAEIGINWDNIRYHVTDYDLPDKVTDK